MLNIKSYARNGFTCGKLTNIESSVEHVFDNKYEKIDKYIPERLKLMDKETHMCRSLYQVHICVRRRWFDFASFCVADQIIRKVIVRIINI